MIALKCQIKKLLVIEKSSDRKIQLAEGLYIWETRACGNGWVKEYSHLKHHIHRFL